MHALCSPLCTAGHNPVTQPSFKLRRSCLWLASQLLEMRMQRLVAEPNESLVDTCCNMLPTPLELSREQRQHQPPSPSSWHPVHPVDPKRGTLTFTIQLGDINMHSVVPSWADATQLIVYILGLERVQDHFHSSLALPALFPSLTHLAVCTADGRLFSLYGLRGECRELGDNFIVRISDFVWSQQTMVRAESGAIIGCTGGPRPPPPSFNWWTRACGITNE